MTEAHTNALMREHAELRGAIATAEQIVALYERYAIGTERERDLALAVAVIGRAVERLTPTGTLR